MRTGLKYPRWILLAVVLSALTARPVVVSAHNITHSIPAHSSKISIQAHVSTQTMVPSWHRLNKMRTQRPEVNARIPLAQKELSFRMIGSPFISDVPHFAARVFHFLVLRI
jgi:hypothetical protein